jgi:hypothetical protein
MKDKIRNIKFPIKNDYFEKSSADGYAYLGFARARLGMDWEPCLKEVSAREFSLGQKWTITATGVDVGVRTKYTYTIWPCVEFYREISGKKSILDKKAIKRAEETLRSIGVYDCGMHRYCDVEINYIVPNMTSAAALMQAYFKNFAEAKELIATLEKNQLNCGNWQYKKIIKGKEVDYVKEDALHLSMMIFQLRESQKILKINLSKIINLAIKALKEMIKKGCGNFSIGSDSAIYLATKGLDQKLEHEFRPKVIKLLDDDNFRKRAFAAFALTR